MKAVRLHGYHQQPVVEDVPEPSVKGPLDVVFCRNVLIYFDRDNKAKVVERLLDRLTPQGYLFLGHAESLGGFTTRARSVLPTVYTLGPGPAQP